MDLETFRAIDVDIDLANDFVPDVILSANDYNGRCIVARVTNGGVSVNGDNLSARLLFNTAPGISPGGYVNMTAVASSPTATWQVPVPSDALAARQVMLCVQIVDSDDNLVCSRNFRGIVDRKLMDDDAPESVNELNRLWEGIDALENIDASVTADGTVSVTAPDGTVTTSTAVPTAVSAANSATTAANNAAGAANTAATDAAQAVADLQAFVPLDADNILKASETGAIVSTDDAYPSPLLGLVAYGNSVQNGTPTPETPVPIKSVHAVSAVTAGENLAKLSARASAITQGITSAVDETGLITASGTATGNANVLISFETIVLKAGQAYTIGLDGTDTRSSELVILFYDRLTNDYMTAARMSASSHRVVYTPSVDAVVRTAYLSTLSGGTVNIAAHLQIAVGSNVSEYVAQNVVTTPLTLIDDQGVAHELRGYGNYRDELRINADGSGTLIKRITTNDSDSSHFWSSANACAYLVRTDGATELNTPCISSMFTQYTGSISNLGAGQFKSGNTSNNIPVCYYKIDGITTSEQFDTWRSTHNVVFAYARATPATYTIPAINMPSLPALVSNAWLSCTDADGAAIAADLSITYRRDINAVIDRIDQRITDTQGTIAPVEGTTASANYAVGSYLMHDDVLYKVTSAIANGETIIPGTNVTATTVMAEIAAING